MTKGNLLRLIVLAASIGISLVLFPWVVTTFSTSIFKTYYDFLVPIQTFGVILLAISVVLFFAAYLGLFDDFGKTTGKALEEMEQSFAALSHDVQKVLEKPATVQRLELPDDMKSEVIASLQQFITEKFPEAVVDDINRKYSKAIFDDDQLRQISRQFNDTINDLKEQLKSWRKNANANLIIGLGAAVAGLIALYFTLIEPLQARSSSAFTFATDRDAVLYFVSRFSLVLIGESVAFFFLKLYREDRAMIRYLRNEITNIEMKSLALRASIPFAKQATLEKILENMMSTERNFLVKKGERIISDVQYENSEIMIEKVLDKLNLKELVSSLKQVRSNPST